MAGPPEEHGDHARGMRVQDDEIADSVLRVGGAEHGRGVVRATVQADGWRALLKELKFLATPEKGEVSALLVRPEDATHLLVLGHGASTNMRHATLQSIADRLAEVGIATFRYNFPSSEDGNGRDGQAVCTQSSRWAVAAARKSAPDLPLLAGGHSFSGRMTSTAASESPLGGVRGLVFYSFPLHPPGKPETKRADHLAAVTLPMLFLSGTRDELAAMDLLRPICEGLGGRA